MNKLKIVFNTLKLLMYWFNLELLAITNIKRSPKDEGKSLVLLSYCLPPQFNSGTHRPLSFLQHSLRFNWHLTGITNPFEGEASEAGNQLLKYVPESVSIEIADTHFKQTSWAMTPKVDGDFWLALSLVKSCLPVIKRDKPNIIVASAPPFCFAIAGMFLSKLTKLPLVLDYRDEWTLCPFSFVSKSWFDKWFEKRCIEQASKIIYTTQTHQISHAEAFNIPLSKQALVFNGWEDDGVELEVNQNSQSNELIISYIGKLSEHVDLKGFFAFIDLTISTYPQIKDRMVFRFIGSKNTRLGSYLEDLSADSSLGYKIKSVGLVTKAEALAMMDSSHYLLMLCNQDLASYIPGKIYDYLSRKKPILAYGYTGEVSQIIEKTQSGFFVKTNDSEAFYNAVVGEPLNLSSNAELENWLQQRTRLKQAGNFFGIAAEVLVNGKTTSKSK